MKSQPTVVFQNFAPLSDKQLVEVFTVSEHAPWFRAMLQILDNWRIERQQAANEFSSANNPLGLAGAHGGMDVLNTVMLDMKRRRINP